ncbi:MAG: DNA primase [Acidimicrobiales bacterium]
MGILAEDVARVRQSTDALAVIGEHIALKRVGRRHQGLCPFHAEKTPSFSVNGEEGLYYCFGCGAKGDVITFVREVEHLDFAGAVERLAGRAGIQLRYDDAATSRDHQRRALLVEAMGRAVEWYHQRLLSAPDAGRARDYLRSRGYDGETVRAYRLGWAPDGWDALARALDLPDDVLRDTGLGFVNRRNRQQDAFRARVMFPILDARGDAVAFGGRVLPGAEGPKYKNSPETALYTKSTVLYGLNWAKSHVVTAGEVVVCEGYTDVIGLARAGVPHAVATCGTALAEAHLRLLKNFARRVVLAYDADTAGQAAAERFYEWERRYELDIAVAALPPGADPADVARRDPEALRHAVAGARPFLTFRLERVLEVADLSTPEGRARAAHAALAVIREHPDDLVRDQYVMLMADRTRVPADRLRADLRSGTPTIHSVPPAGRSGTGSVAGSAGTAPVRRRPGDSSDGSSDSGSGGNGRTGPEIEALKAVIHARHDQAVSHLDAVLFPDELCAGAFQALVGAASVHEAIEAADPGAAALLQRLAVEDFHAEPTDVVALLVGIATRRAIEELESMTRASGDVSTYAPTIGWLKLRGEELRYPDTALGAIAGLVAWLVDRLEGEG